MIRALVSLGLRNPLLDLESLLKLLDSYVLVAIGPFAEQFWQQKAHAGDQNHNPHTQGFCAFCQEFCLHGSCEHLHTAFLDLRQLSQQQPKFAKRQRQTPLFEQKPVEVILPAPSSAASRPHVRAQSSQPLSVPQENAGLTKFLQAYRWGMYASVLHQEQMTVTLMASLPFSDLKTALPSLPSGVLLAMQPAAQEWLRNKVPA